VSWALAVLAAFASLVVVWWRLKRRGERQRALMLLCDRAGLEFAPMDLAPDTAWLPFPMFGRSRSGTENVVWGRTRGPGIRVFDLWFVDEEGEQPLAPREYRTCAVVPISASCPRLRIEPRDLTDEARVLVGMREIRLELEAFNRRFVVETEDERFAIAFLEQRMMEALLGLPRSVSVETNEDVMLLTSPLLPPVDVLRLFDAAVELSERIPRSLGSLFPKRPDRAPREGRWLQGHWSPEPTA
jgi:hypothetical protein